MIREHVWSKAEGEGRKGKASVKERRARVVAEEVKSELYHVARRTVMSLLGGIFSKSRVGTRVLRSSIYKIGPINSAF